MRRLHRNAFWRVESERWDWDLDSDSFYQGTETFMGGTSEPFSTLATAEKSALQRLEQGYWVKITHYPSQFVEASSGADT